MTRSNLINLFESSRRKAENEAESLVGNAESIKDLIQGRKHTRKANKLDINRLEVIPDTEVSNDGYRKLWREHEIEWTKFSMYPPNPILFSSVPFPPCDNDVLEFTSIVQALRPSKAYHIACLRYHPDKFLQQFGKFLDPSDAESIVAKLNSITQSINLEWKNRKKSSRFSSSIS